MAGESLIVGVEVDGRCWFSQLIDTSGTPREQARRLLSLLFPSVLADSTYDQYGDIVAAARAQLSPDLVQRQAAARWTRGIAMALAHDFRSYTLPRWSLLGLRTS
jgi:hypothetical protein